MGFITGTIDMEDESIGFSLFENYVYTVNKTSIRKFLIFSSEGMAIGLNE